MRRVLFALIPSLFAAQSGAQVIRRGSLGQAPPSVYVSLGAGAMQGWGVSDGTTGSRWDFGNATQYVASIEKAYTGATLGLRGTTATVPLTYTGAATPNGAYSGDAQANVSQLLAAVHVATGQGFHSVLELDAGATYYSNFRARPTGAALAPTSDADFTFSFGYGVGYGFSNRFGIEVVQDLTTVMHQHTGLVAGEDTSVRLHSTRLVGRFGLGERR